VVFVCESPAGETRARLAKREDIFSDDVVGVLLDTYHDRQRGYEFFVNPLGVQADATESESQNDDFSFDTLWYSEGRITPEGFAAMLAIPFRSLRFSHDRAPGQTSDPEDPHQGDHAVIGVVRVQREFAKQSNVGVQQ
jgi:hypothetical protein